MKKSLFSSCQVKLMWVTTCFINKKSSGKYRSSSVPFYSRGIILHVHLLAVWLCASWRLSRLKFLHVLTVKHCVVIATAGCAINDRLSDKQWPRTELINVGSGLSTCEFLILVVPYKCDTA